MEALKEATEEDLTVDTLRLGYVKSDEKQFKICDKKEIEGFLNEL